MPAKKHKPTSSEISPGMWKLLYAKADAFAQLRMWECVPAQDLIGVLHPLTGEPVLVGVTGQQKEVFSVILYDGNEALRWLLGEDDGTPETSTEDLLGIAGLKVEFAQKRELLPEEKLRIQAIGFVPRSKRWPVFRKQTPGCVPWHIDEEDAFILLSLLPQITALCALLRPAYENGYAQTGNSFPFWPNGKDPDQPLPISEIKQFGVKPPPQPPTHFTVDEVTMANLAALPRQVGLVLEVDAIFSTDAIPEGERPWFPKLAMVVENRTGIVAGFEMSKGPNAHSGILAGQVLVAAMKAMRVRPEAVHVTQSRIATTLTPFAQPLGITVLLQKKLPQLKKALTAMPAGFGFGR